MHGRFDRVLIDQGLVQGLLVQGRIVRSPNEAHGVAPNSPGAGRCASRVDRN